MSVGQEEVCNVDTDGTEQERGLYLLLLIKPTNVLHVDEGVRKSFKWRWCFSTWIQLFCTLFCGDRYDR